jgi:integrase
MPPKSDRGYRDVPIPPSLSGMLRRHRKAQTKRRLTLGEAWTDSDLIAERGDGRPMDPDTFGDAFRRARKKAKVPGVRLHDLRHHYGTIMMGAGVDIVTVSRALGHASTVLMNVYTHPTEEMAAPLARTAEDALGKALGQL